MTDIRNEWADLTLRSGPQASLPVDVITAFIPVKRLLVLADLISDGPAVADFKVGAVIQAEMRRVLPATRSRPAGPPAKGSIAALQTALRRCMGYCVELRAIDDNPYLQPWLQAPAPRPIPVAGDVTARKAPELRHIRIAYRELFTTVATHFKDSNGDLLAAVEATSDTRLRHKTKLRDFRLLALLVAVFITGGRRWEVTDLRRSDLVHDHQAPDGEVGYALRMEPDKQTDGPAPVWKPIPEEAGRLLAAFQLYVERATNARYGLRIAPDGPMWPADLSTPNVPLGHSRLYQLFAGTRSNAPLVGSTDPAAAAHVGYATHRYRDACMQAVKRGGPEFLEERGIQADPFQIVECLVNHSVITEDRYGYYGINRTAGREQYSKYGTHIAWEMLATDRGARKMLDVDAIAAATAESSRIVRELKEVRGTVDRLLAQASRRGDGSDELSLMTRLLESQRLLARERVLATSLGVVEEELKALRTDPARQVAVPDEWADRDIPKLAEQSPQLPRPRVRDYHTVAEIGEIAGVSPATARRWANGESLPHRAGDPRNPWELDAIPIDDRFGVKRRRIPVASIKPGFFDSEAKRRRSEELLASWPAGWSPEDAL